LGSGGGQATAVGRVLLVRHAESTWNAVGRIQGWADAPLSPRGREQAAALAEGLAAQGPAPEGPAAVRLVISSDLARAVETAAIVGRRLGCPPPVVDARWREREIGWWSGLTNDELALREPETVARWRARQIGPPGGESDQSLLSRSRAALAEAGRRAAGLDGPAVVLVVSHGALISLLERTAGAGPGGFPNLAGAWVDWQEGEPVFTGRLELGG
jgi:broad specificity phosphatase PhoE